MSGFYQIWPPPASGGGAGAGTVTQVNGGGLITAVGSTTIVTLTVSSVSLNTQTIGSISLTNQVSGILPNANMSSVALGNASQVTGSVSLTNQVVGNLPLSQTSGSISLTNQVVGFLPIQPGGNTTGSISLTSQVSGVLPNANMSAVALGTASQVTGSISLTNQVSGILPQANLTLTPTFTQHSIGSVTVTSSAGGTAITWTLPGSYGSAGQSLSVSSAGFLSFQTPAGATFPNPTIQKFTTSSGSYTLPTSPSPTYIQVVMVGGGGGGGASGIGGGTGVTGSASTFGTALLSAAGGIGGTGAGGITGGSGGVASLGSGPIGLALAGGGGCPAQGGSATVGTHAGNGGSSAFGGAGKVISGAAGGAGVTNSGGGGAGGDDGTGGTTGLGAGGGSGGYVNAIITSPAASYAYSVGAGGTTGTGGNADGGAGGSGVIVVTEFYGPTGATTSSAIPIYSYQTLSANGSVSVGQYVTLSGASFNVGLPTAVGVAGQSIILQHGGTSFSQAYTLQTVGSSGQTIGGIGSGLYTLYTNTEVIHLMSTGTTWNIAARVTETAWSVGTGSGVAATGTALVKGTILQDKMVWKRRGENLLMRVQYQQNGAGTDGTGIYIVPLPLGCQSINSASIFTSTDTGNGAASSVGPSCQGGGYGGNNTDRGVGIPRVYDATHFAFQIAETGASNTWGPSAFGMSNTNLGVGFHVEVPIVAWQP